MNQVCKKTKRLYGSDVNPKNWKHMDYYMVLEEKIKLASKRITVLFTADKMVRDNNNIAECEKSIKLCRDMLKELEM